MTAESWSISCNSSAVSSASILAFLDFPADFEFLPLPSLPPLFRLGDFLPGERDFLLFGDFLLGDLDFLDLLRDFFLGDFDLLFLGDLLFDFFGDFDLLFFGDFDLLFDFLGDLDLLFDFLRDLDLLFLEDALFLEGDFFLPLIGVAFNDLPYLPGDFRVDLGDFLEDLLREVDRLSPFLTGLLPRFVSLSGQLSLASSALVPAAMLTCLRRKAPLVLWFAAS